MKPGMPRRFTTVVTSPWNFLREPKEAQRLSAVAWNSLRRYENEIVGVKTIFGDDIFPCVCHEGIILWKMENVIFSIL